MMRLVISWILLYATEAVASSTNRNNHNSHNSVRRRHALVVEAPKDCAAITCPVGSPCQIVNGYAVCVEAEEEAPPVIVTDREAPTDCKIVVCNDGEYCTVSDGYAYCVRGEEPSPITISNPTLDDPCDGECDPDDEVCILQDVTCVTTPCDPIPICITDPCIEMECKPGYICTVDPSDGSADCKAHTPYYDGPLVEVSSEACPTDEPVSWDPCPEALEGAECSDALYGGDKYCARKCEQGEWAHLCMGGGDGILPPMLGDDYCTWGPDEKCFESGWPACCSNDSKPCPEIQPPCELPQEEEEEEDPCATVLCREGDRCEVDDNNNAVCVEDYYEEKPILFCTQDAIECPDGSYVGRNPEHDCDFDACPSEGADTNPCATVRCKEGYSCEVDREGNADCIEIETQVFCTMDVKTCPDGSYVGRDPSNGCAFDPCPTELYETTSSNPCDTVLCEEGTTCEVDTEGVTTCVSDSEETTFCTKDVRTCPDGSYVGRDPSNGCEFDPCPDKEEVSPGKEEEEEVGCTEDARECPDGTIVVRDPDNDCKFEPCPETRPEDDGPKACTKDARRCPDGSMVGRDPDNDCNFYSCVEQTTTSLIGRPSGGRGQSPWMNKRPSLGGGGGFSFGNGGSGGGLSVGGLSGGGFSFPSGTRPFESLRGSAGGGGGVGFGTGGGAAGLFGRSGGW
eukprot:CAMPEP_0178911546 /NCGR_PEP_ID=MMETSP0786-20121207/9760_1 /TAXON_ID=186022 /ORGANISM="Thalassionema frauenfeldii, Strain CCMP 1798" /LENGTH=681 /DNA_ID=CAMNT_0020584015 /DNA_START=360 /DNA_END=2405 /DNA_ORIENTATION=-